MAEVIDVMTLRRVANGWVVFPGRGICDDFTHVYVTPSDLAKHVETWAAAQVAGPPRKAP